MSRTKKTLLVILMTFLIAVLCGCVYLFGVYNSLLGAGLDLEQLSINKELNNKVINIALFGLDGRDDPEVDGDRTDSLMIATLDTRDDSVKVTSIMRDTFAKICVPQDAAKDSEHYGVEIDTPQGSEDYEKINAAYEQGGAQGTIRTINENFDLNIQDYVSVDFTCLIDVVDALGGVEIDIPNDSVLYWTNEYLKESNGYAHKNDPNLTHTGMQTLTGAQALAFARNRYSDSDYGRTQRQREVIQAIFNKAKTMSGIDAVGMITKIYPYIKTSLSLDEMSTYAKFIIGAENMDFEDFRVPTNDYGTGGYIGEVWYLFPDTLLDNAKALHTFIYGDSEVYTPSETVEAISAEIQNIMQTQARDLTKNIGTSLELERQQANEEALQQAQQQLPQEQQ